MKATNIPSFNLESSLKRIDAILNADNNQFEEANSIPNRDKLTYTNGFYVNCAALFVDIRESSTMTDEHRRPVLAKVYRSFISEIVALFNENNITKEVNIHGDCVWCVCDTPYKSDIDELFSMAARACSMVDILNYKLKKKGYTTYSVGVGIDYGRALMIKAGCDGSGISESRELIHHAESLTCSDGYAGDGIFCDAHIDTDLGREHSVETIKERAATGHHDAMIHDHDSIR